jgi:hypothetical protein
VIFECISAKCVNTPSPSEWSAIRAAAWVPRAGEPTMCTTGTCSAKLPATALMALSSPTPKVVHRAPMPRIRA